MCIYTSIVTTAKNIKYKNSASKTTENDKKNKPLGPPVPEFGRVLV